MPTSYAEYMFPPDFEAMCITWMPVTGLKWGGGGSPSSLGFQNQVMGQLWEPVALGLIQQGFSHIPYPSWMVNTCWRCVESLVCIESLGCKEHWLQYKWIQVWIGPKYQVHSHVLKCRSHGSGLKRAGQCGAIAANIPSSHTPPIYRSESEHNQFKVLFFKICLKTAPNLHQERFSSTARTAKLYVCLRSQRIK